MLKSPYLSVEDAFAQGVAEEPGLRHVPEHRRRQTENQHHEVSDGQVDDEIISDGPHAWVADDGRAHQQVADQAGDENEAVERDQQPLGRRRENVAFHERQVVIVGDAVVIGAVGRRVVVVGDVLVVQVHGGESAGKATPAGTPEPLFYSNRNCAKSPNGRSAHSV